MRISHLWLSRYLDPAPAADDVADRVTMAGFPVDDREACAGPDGTPGGDWSLDVEVTWNRPDCQCHIGVAREVAGLLGATLRLPEVSLPALCDDRIDVAVEAPDLCPLYTARVVRGVRVGPSPAWLVHLLEAAGQRSVNNVVDVTNFVLLECGQPLHAFDLARVSGPRLVARRATREKLVAIDGSELELGADDLVIADADGPSALAGVMGGQRSEVGPATVDLVLEAALFEALGIRETARRRRIHSESSFRFERHVDPTRVRWASDRAAALFVELCGATSVGPLCEAGPGVQLEAEPIDIRTARVERVLGIAVGEDEIQSALSALGLAELPDAPQGVTRWRAPAWRPDLRVEIDLVEEVARRIGFDRIPSLVAVPVRPLAQDPLHDARLRLRDSLVAAGLHECCTAPFVGEGPSDIALLTDVPALRVQNPMRAEESLLRRSLLGPLLLVTRGNRDRGVPAVRLFECASAYLRRDDGSTEELRLAAGVITGAYELGKGAVEAVLERAGLAAEVAWSRGGPAPLHPDRSATVTLDGNVLGYVGELRPGALSEFGLEADTTVFELDAGALALRTHADVVYRAPSRYPPVERDLAVSVEEAVSWAAIAAVVRRAAGQLLANLAPFDVFRGDQVGEGRKSVAFRMELRAPDRTLTGEEADACVAAIIQGLADETGAALRS